MIRTLMTVAAIVSIAGAGPALAAPCKDAKGKFTKCPPAVAPAASVTRDAKGKCHVASGPKKGQFTKCP